MDDLAPRRRGPVPEDAPAVPRGSLGLAFVLLGLAGWVGAIGLVQWGELYMSFMSGNTIAFGASPAVGDWHGTWQAGLAVPVFVTGVVAGEIIGSAAGPWRVPAVVATEAALLWLSAWSAVAGWSEVATAPPVGLAMGVQTAAMREAGGVGVGLTYVTGTLVSVGRSLAAALRGGAPWAKTLPFLGFWAAMLTGAAAGSVVTRTGLDHALAAAATVASATAAFAGATARQRER